MEFWVTETISVWYIIHSLNEQSFIHLKSIYGAYITIFHSILGMQELNSCGVLGLMGLSVSLVRTGKY